jgi:predicted nucleic acid-binding protein
MAQIADTGFLVAYWNGADLHHRWARGLSLRAPLLSCAPVLTEAAYLLGNPEPLLQMLVDDDLRVDFDLAKHAPGMLLWLDKFSDLDPGLADACVVALAELTPRAEILMTDRRDFSAYRTLGGKPLRCVFPPVR